MIVGITGGIGSGKSTVASIFAYLGIPVYESDTAAKNIIDNDQIIQQQLVLLVGPAVLKNGKVNRPYMAEAVFDDPELLSKVNSVIHPAVAKDFKNWYKKRSHTWVLKEAAILFESGSYRECDKIIVVTAPEEMRVQRVINRSNISRQEVLSRMSRQWPESRKRKLADYVIRNNHSRSVIEQVLHVYEDIERRANKGGRPVHHRE